MTRFTLPLVLCALVCALMCVPANGEDPPKKLTYTERLELETKWKDLNAAGLKAFRGGNDADAMKLFEEGLRVARRLYNKTDFPNGHANLASSLNNLATVYGGRGRWDDVESLLKDALATNRLLFKGDHPDVFDSLSKLALLYRTRGKWSDAEGLFKDALDMCRRLHKGDHPDVVESLSELSAVYRAQGKWGDAESLLRDALDMTRRLFKGDHPRVAVSMNALAALYLAQGRWGEAEPLFKDALALRRRLFEGDHPDVARGMNNLAMLYRAQGKRGDAESLLRDALDMTRRLFKGDHPDLATGMSNLAVLYEEQGKLGDAESLCRDALAMSRRMFAGDHPFLARRLARMASLHQRQEKWRDAELLYKEVLGMRRRLYAGDHLDVAESMNNLAFLFGARGEWAAAEPLLKDSLAITRRLFVGDHADVATGLSNLAFSHMARGEWVAAEPLLKDALAMNQRLTVAFARNKSEGETLTFFAQHSGLFSAYITDQLERRAGAEAVYPQLWAEKGHVTRAYERRQLQARAAAADPTTANALADLTEARRRRIELLLAPPTKDPATLARRDEDIRACNDRIENRTRELEPRLPALGRIEKLDAATPADLQKMVPPDVAVVDYYRFIYLQFDKDKPGKTGEIYTPRYFAFVVTKDKVAWVDLDTAAVIKPAIDAWHEAITGGKEIPDAMAAKVRELVWEKVRKELPPGTKTVYVCPDAALCRLPFAAIPGDKPNTVLLDDYAIATIPHAPFLLDKLWPQDERKNQPTDALVVGNVKYDAAVTAKPGPATASGPLFKPDAKPIWKPLPNTAGEANGIAAAAGRKKVATARIEGADATPAAVLAALPKAKYAHFATHGFFADASFRSALQLDPKDYENRGGERIGRAALSPLVMTGLVFAGANNPDAPGRGIVTGEQLIDLDLSGLELAVLSACETGLGDVAGGQGVFGLQRAFHYAGATNVVCSLWKVPDEPTAALMGAFYSNLWDKGLSPMESLRQAQLEIYRNPGKIPALAKGFRGVFEEVDGPKVEAKAGADGTAHPLLWAAFTLSGPGK